MNYQDLRVLFHIINKWSFVFSKNKDKLPSYDKILEIPIK